MSLELGVVNKKTVGAFRYQRARQGVQKRKPAAGQCAWQHRAISSKEGSEAVIVVPGGTTTTVRAAGSSARARSASLNKLIRYVSRPGRQFSMVVSFDAKRKRLRIQKIH